MGTAFRCVCRTASKVEDHSSGENEGSLANQKTLSCRGENVDTASWIALRALGVFVPEVEYVEELEK